MPRQPAWVIVCMHHTSTSSRGRPQFGAATRHSHVGTATEHPHFGTATEHPHFGTATEHPHFGTATELDPPDAAASIAAYTIRLPPCPVPGIPGTQHTHARAPHTPAAGAAPPPLELTSAAPAPPLPPLLGSGRGAPRAHANSCEPLCPKAGLLCTRSGADVCAWEGLAGCVCTTPPAGAGCPSSGAALRVASMSIGAAQGWDGDV
eukprot:1151905-Pelagomonas_calceolata.AAC.3